MICPNCGKQINDGDLFCAYCRQRVGSQPVQQTIQPVYVQPEQPVNNMDPNQTGNAQSVQSAYQQNSAAKEQHPAAVFFTTLLVGGVLIASFIMFIKPGYMLGRDNDDSSSRKKKSDSSVSAVEVKADEKAGKTTTKKSPDGDDESSSGDVVTTAGTTKKTTATDDPIETATATTKTTTSSSATATTKTTTKSTADNTTTTAAPSNPTTTTAAPKSDDDIAKEEAANYSTDEKPSFSDFEWCYGQFGLVQDPPNNVEYLMQPGSWTGGWKCMIVYSTSENGGQYIREINNVYIGIEDTSISMTVKHYIYEIDGESYDDSITAKRYITVYSKRVRIKARNSLYMTL